MKPRSRSLLACLLAAVVAIVGVVAWACADVDQVDGRLTWVTTFHLDPVGVLATGLADSHGTASRSLAGADTALTRFQPAAGPARDEASPPGPPIRAFVPLRHAATKATGRRAWLRRSAVARRWHSNQRQPAARTEPAPASRRSGRSPRRRRTRGRTRGRATRRSRAAAQHRQPHDGPEPLSTKPPSTELPCPERAGGLTRCRFTVRGARHGGGGAGRPGHSGPPNAELDPGWKR